MPNNALTIAIFLAFVGFTLGLSFWLGRKAKSAAGYFAAHGQVGWFVNGIAFAGDYLSAASFLGICGMIAFYGYDGFLYSIGFLAGWVVALFVIAEPIKKLGKYTFADALNAKFNSPGITLAAAISTLVVSVFYLIPQMVGAGSLLKALLGLKPHLWHGIDLNHAIGVTLVGAVVILIVVTAGMVSTTWVQFIKGSLLVIFCTVLTGMILSRGINVHPDVDVVRAAIDRSSSIDGSDVRVGTTDMNYTIASGIGLVAFQTNEDQPRPPAKLVSRVGDGEDSRTPLGFIKSFNNLELLNHSPHPIAGVDGGFRVHTTQTSELLLPGGSPTFKGIRSAKLTDRLDFVSLMLALFCGTASLPHILIRYYTVKDAVAARKSTVVGIGAIGFFYILTLYIGLGAMVSGNLDPSDSNMAAPLLAKSFNEPMFAIISAIAFTTVLGTVSGLILAAAGAVAHDLRKIWRDRFAASERWTSDVGRSTLKPGELEYERPTSNAQRPTSKEDDDRRQVKIAKLASVVVGLIAILLGIIASNFNVTFLVGWAFNVAASANLPAIVMLLFWRGTTRQGIIWSIVVGLVSSLTWLLLSAPAYANIYAKFVDGVNPANAIAPFSQPGLVTIPLAFIVLVVVSLITRRSETARGFDVQKI